MAKSGKISLYVFWMLYIIFLLQDCFVTMGISAFGYYDEFLSMLFLIVLALKIVANHFTIRISLPGMITLMMYFIFIIAGLAGNILHANQTFIYILLDILTSSKMILGLIGAKIFFPNGLGEEKSIGLLKITKIYIVVLFVLAVHDWFMTPFFQVGYDNAILGLASKYIYLMYSNPTYLAAYAIAAMIVLIYIDEFHGSWPFIVMDSVVIVLTTRSKAWGFLCFSLLIYLITNKSSSVKSIKNRIAMVVPLGIATVLFVAMDKIIVYFFTPTHYSPRSILLQEGISLAKKYFPFGNGFGTYCSVAAITTGRGLELLPYNKTAYYDAFWGCMTGQFGFLGTAAFVGLIGVLLVDSMSLIQFDKKSWYAAIFAFAYLLIASLGETSFFSQYSVCFGFMIGLALTCKRRKNVE